jgi:PKD repeat protein
MLLAACVMVLVVLPGGSLWAHAPVSTSPALPSPGRSPPSASAPHRLAASGAPDWIDVTSRYGSAPSTRAFANIAWDTSSSEAILFGGENGAATDGDTWSFTPAAGWKQICSSCSPAGRAEAEYAYDSTDNVIVMFGGCEGLSGCPVSDTWTYSSGTWTQSSKGVTPNADLAGAMSDDPSDGDTVMFGGCSDFQINILNPGASACATSSYLDTTYTFTVSGGWVKASPTNVPAAREAEGLAYNPLTGTVLMYGGWDGATSTTYGDMWAFHAGQWFELHPTSTPGPLSNFAMFWDGSLNEMIAFAGDTATSTVNTTWAYSNGNWTQLNPSNAPSARDGTMATAPPSGFPVDFGGETSGGSNNLADTWVFGPPLTATASASPTATDVTLPVTFSATLSGGQPPYKMSWSFGDNSPAAATANTTHAYRFPGSGDVANFSVTDSYGFSSGKSFTIAVNPLPTLAAAASPGTGGPGNVTSFWANATGGTSPLTYSWNFGDGATSTLADPQHIYSTAANYTVVASVVDALGQSATASVPVVVKIPPGALGGRVSASPTSGQGPLTVDLTSHISGGVAPYSYFWQYGDGTRASFAPDPVHTYNSTGTFLADLTVNDSAGHTQSWGVQVQVLPGALHLTATANASAGDTPLYVSFASVAAGGIGPYNYTWSLGDGTTSFLADPSHVYVDPLNTTESYAAEVIVRDSNVPAATLNQTFPLLVEPTLSVSIFMPPPPPVGATATFYANASGGTPPYTYAWNFGDGTILAAGPENSSQHAYQTNQSYHVFVTVTDARGRSASTFGTVQPGASDAKESESISLFTGSGIWLYLAVPLTVGAMLTAAVILGVGGSASKMRWRPPRSPPHSGKYAEPVYYPGHPLQ